MQPLSDYRILSFGQAWSAPYADMMLADMGADVVKVEPPGVGDHVRRWSRGDLKGLSPHLLAVNRNKRGIVIDLLKPEGREIALELMGRADAVIENFSPGTMAKLGVDYAVAGKRHPRLVYCSVSGFGSAGPYARHPAYDLVMQGEGGLISVTGTEDGQMAKVGVPVIDVMTAMVAAFAIVCALRHVEKTGQGRYLDLSMLETAASVQAYNVVGYSITGEAPVPLGTAHPLLAPYQVYSTRTQPIGVAILTEAHWKEFCTLIGHPEYVADPRFRTAMDRIDNRPALNDVLMPILVARPAEYWLAEFVKRGLVGGAVNDIPALLSHPQLAARQFFQHWTLDGGQRVSVPGTPWRTEGRAEPVRRQPPRLGEHTEEVLAEWLGLGTGQIGKLLAEGAVRDAATAASAAPGTGH